MLIVADSSMQILLAPGSGRKTLKVTEWQLEILSVADVIALGRYWYWMEDSRSLDGIGRY